MTAMKNKITLSALAAASLLAVGCVAPSQPVVVDNHEEVAAAVKMEPARIKPILDIGASRVSGRGEAVLKQEDSAMPSLSLGGLVGNGAAMTDPSVFDGLSPLEKDALSDAIEKTCRANRCQYLLAPRFEIKTVGRRATCMVTGFPANVIAVVPVDPADTPAAIGRK